MGIFRTLSALQVLRLDGLRLELLNPRSFSGLDSLTTLTLRNSKLKTIPNLFNQLPSIIFIDLIKSPIHCDSDTVKFAGHEHAGKISATCETTKGLQDKYWWDVNHYDLKDAPNRPQKMTVPKPRSVTISDEEYEEIEIPAITRITKKKIFNILMIPFMKSFSSEN